MELNNTAIVVVDMQKCFANPEGSLYSPASEEIIGDLNEFVDYCRDNGSTIIYTKDTHTEEQFENLDNYDEFDRWGEHAIKGSWEHNLVDGLDIEEEDFVVNKNTYDAFMNDNFQNILEENNVDNVIVVGTLVNVCVMHTASSAALNDYKAVVLEDLVGYIKEDHKDYALEHIDWLFGQVMGSDEVV